MKSADNSILREFRIWDTEYDAEYTAFEWAFQANRLAAQSGPPILAERGFRDPFGPATREESEESGEDYYYWLMVDLHATPQEIMHAADVLTRLYVLRRTD